MNLRHSSSYPRRDFSNLLRNMSLGRTVETTSGNWQVSLKRRFQDDFDLIRARTSTDQSYFAAFPHLNLYLLRHDDHLGIPGHDRGECVVLEDRQSGAHVVLHGEINKASLDYLGGICGFATAGTDPVAEVRRLFDLWDQDIAPLKAAHQNYYRLVDQLRTTFTEIPFEPAAEKFLVPIAHLQIRLASMQRPAPVIADAPQSLPPPRQ